jgi:hypothetical protein
MVQAGEDQLQFPSYSQLMSGFIKPSKALRAGSASKFW